MAPSRGSDDEFDRAARALGTRPISMKPLSGGCVGDVRLLEMPGGSRCVAKLAPPSDRTLQVEAAMLDELRRDGSLRVPAVLAVAPGLLAMEFIENDGRVSGTGERSLAEGLASLHTPRPGGLFGLEYDTVIGGLAQPNSPGRGWGAFYAEHRLRAMADEARRAGALPSDADGLVRQVADRVEALGDDRLGECVPALLHGDLWSGNVLWNGGDLAAVIDPAVYRGHPEVELAFMRLFGGFGPEFWSTYRAIRSIDAEFDRWRCELYQLYPLLVHVRLFGAGYVGPLVRAARPVLAALD